jgi:membrane protein
MHNDEAAHMNDREKRELVMEQIREKEAVEHRRGRWWALKEVYNKFSDKDGMTQAAALAFYSGLSLAPLLTVLAWISRNVLHRDSKETLIGGFEQVIGPQAAAPIRDILDPASQQAQVSMTLAGIISLAILAFSATGVFGQLQSALNHMWDVQAAPSAGLWAYVKKRILSFGMLISIMFLLLISMVASAAIQGFVTATGLPEGWLLQIVNTVVSLAIFTVVFAAMFKFVPDAQIAWRDVWFGGALSAVMFVIGKFLLGLYLGRGSYQSAYGAAVGSFVALLVWVYYSSIIVFIGAEAAQVYARRHGHQPKPEGHAVKVVQKTRPVAA